MLEQETAYVAIYIESLTYASSSTSTVFGSKLGHLTEVSIYRQDK